MDLDSLSMEQQQQLYSELAFRFSKGAGKAELALPDRAMFDLIAHVLGEHYGRNVNVFFPNWVKSYGTNKYLEKVAVINDTVDEGLGRIMRRPQRREIVANCISCLVESLIDRDMSLSVGTVITQADYLRTAVNKQFPGYIKARMLHRIGSLI